MPCISLDIFRAPHEPAAQIGYSLEATRLVAHITFRGAAAWTAYQPGIVDTGAAVSLLPAQVWRDVENETIGEVRIGGVIAREQYRISARLATLTCALSDGVELIGPLTIRAYLADSNDVPLLLGVCDLIENGELTVAIKKQHAIFEL